MRRSICPRCYGEGVLRETIHGVVYYSTCQRCKDRGTIRTPFHWIRIIPLIGIAATAAAIVYVGWWILVVLIAGFG